MKKLLKSAISIQKEYIESSKHSANPQVVAMVIEARGKLAAYEATLSALNGDKFLLKLDSRKL